MSEGKYPSESKDPSEKRESDNSYGSFEMPDMDSTVRLDFSGNVISTSSEENSSSDDFDQTIDGLMDIEELLKNEDPLSESDKEVSTVSFNTDDINLDELDADINSLSDGLPDSGSDDTSNSDDSITEDDRLDSLDEPFSMDDETDAGSDTPEENSTDLTSDENEFLFSDDNTTDEKTVDEAAVDIDTAASEQPETGESGLDDLDLNIPDVTETENETGGNEEPAPVIELTEAMLDESSDETKEQSYDDDETDIEEMPETPELTTTETNVLAGATAAIKEMHDEESHHPRQESDMPESDMPTTSIPEFSSMPSDPPPSSNTLPTILAILGVAAGGFGAWMAFDATSKISELQSQLRDLQAAKANSADKKTLADLQQRLAKVERRLTGTPTVEAASPLGSTGPVAEDASLKEKDEKPKIKVITPQTPIASPAKKEPASAAVTGDWVVNVSSHNKADAAQKEAGRLNRLGLNSEVHAATIKGKTWYRVQIVGYDSKTEAKAALKDVQQRSGIKGAWIGKR